MCIYYHTFVLLYIYIIIGFNHLFKYLLDILAPFFLICLYKFFAHFSIWFPNSFFFYLHEFFNIPYGIYLSIVDITNIFSHSVICLLISSVKHY